MYIHSLDSATNIRQLKTSLLWIYSKLDFDSIEHQYFFVRKNVYVFVQCGTEIMSKHYSCENLESRLSWNMIFPFCRSKAFKGRMCILHRLVKQIHWEFFRSHLKFNLLLRIETNLKSQAVWPEVGIKLA